ncbi:MAG: cyclase family protein [Chthoniobacterales bacterium]
MEIFDISRTLCAELAAWPGDVSFRSERNASIADGSNVNLSAMQMSLHNGTHADAKFHFDSSGWTMEQAALANYFGPVVVVDLTHLFREGVLPDISVSHLAAIGEELRAAPRLLLKTNVWRDSAVFPTAIPVVAPEVPEWLRARGVRLLGLDVPSVDRIDSRDLPNHHSLGAAGICIVESLDLSAAAAGKYQFAGLPLKVAGGDGAPVRAILWRE